MQHLLLLVGHVSATNKNATLPKCCTACWYKTLEKQIVGPHLAAMPYACNCHLPAKNLMANLGIILIQLVELSHLLGSSTSEIRLISRAILPKTGCAVYKKQER